MKTLIVVLAIAASALVAPEVRAASLFGRVVEVNSGDVITVFNLNRPVRVKLLGVDAPEMDQAFGDVARKHLFDLVYDQSVVVEYSGISADGSLGGRVLLNSTDIGAQMIRDGAAWFDLNNFSRLSETDREVYRQSEEAARSERRGLWQAEHPTAPWEFVKGKSFGNHPVARVNANVPANVVRANGAASQLDNFSLMTSRIASTPQPPTRTLSSADFAGAYGPAEHGNWRLLRPARENFSILVPEAGEQKAVPIPGGDRVITSYAYRARDGWSIFGVVWFTGVTYGEADGDAMRNTLTAFLKGFASGYESHKNAAQPGFSCELQNEQDISTGGYTGLEFDLKSCTIPAKARVFTRVVNGDRQMYLATVFYLEDDPNVSRFINSFNVGPPPPTKPSRR
jgi:endonuclease YncB( thermonuclease family)